MKEERILDVTDGKVIEGVVENEERMSSIFFTK